MPYLALPGGIELWWILVAILLLFGAKKLPELARAMGNSITQFKKGLSEEGAPTEQIDSKSSTHLEEGSGPREEEGTAKS